MKKIIVLVLILGNGMLFAQKNGLMLSKLDWQNDLQPQNFKGKEKSVEIYDFNSGLFSQKEREKQRKEKQFSELFKYNEHGNFT